MAVPPTWQPPPRIPSHSEMLPTIERHIAETQTLINHLTHSITAATASFDNVVRPLAQLENRQCGERAVIEAMKYCHPDEAYRRASQQAEQAWEESTITRGENERDLYALLKAVQAKNEALDEESARLLVAMLRRYEQNKSESWQHNAVQIAELCAEFQANLREDASGEWFTPEELDGVPEKERDTYPFDDNGERQFVAHKGHSFAVLQHANDSNTRKKMYLSDRRRLAKNVPIFKEVVLLRDENARALGYRSHAEYRIPDRIAESTEWVNTMLGGLADRLLPYGRAEDERYNRAVEDSARSQGYNGPIMPWDDDYFKRLGPDEKRVDWDAISEYFPLRETVKGMMKLFGNVLQLSFSPLSGDDLRKAVWHDDVEGWCVWDDRPTFKGDFIGYLYADLLSRPNKYHGNQSVNLQRGYLREDGTRVYPANILMCNFRPSESPSRCHLLGHARVVTLFHEFGHALHDLLSRTTYAHFHGYEAVQEFVEAIAMTFEQWCWLRDELKAMSRHYTRVDPSYTAAWLGENPGRDLPPETIPDHLLDPLFKWHARGKTHQLLNDLRASIFDMAVHNPPTREALTEMNEMEVYDSIYQKLHPAAPLETSPHHKWVHSGHLLAGYDAGYYSYICAQVFAAGLFQTTFAAKPRCRRAWERFRTEVLESGGSRDELEVLKAHLGGREPGLEPLLNVVRGVEGL
ncbi:hypothetical protein QBC39DRAFT_287785 [Podospora conica]|nr:hypothetical protein QBC39DRAFT_287785 [Schizothecium conicum]